MVKLVKCPKCKKVFYTNKNDVCQCGKIISNGSICGERFSVKDNVLEA